MWMSSKCVLCMYRAGASPCRMPHDIGRGRAVVPLCWNRRELRDGVWANAPLAWPCARLALYSTVTGGPTGRAMQNMCIEDDNEVWHGVNTDVIAAKGIAHLYVRDQYRRNIAIPFCAKDLITLGLPGTWPRSLARDLAVAMTHHVHRRGAYIHTSHAP